MQSNETTPYRLTKHQPYSTFKDGKPVPTQYVVGGLMPNGSLTLLAAKPKTGKSNLSRHLAVCVSKGQDFLGRTTTKGQVMLMSFEDSLEQCDKHLRVSGWTPETDELIHIVTELSPSADDNLAAVEHEIVRNPELRLVVVDLLQHLVQVGDSNDIIEVSRKLEELHKIAKRNPHCAIVAIMHAKKVTNSDDPFDAMLGSSGYRAQSSTNMVLFERDGRRFLCAETRVGRRLPSTVIEADLVRLDGDEDTEYVCNYRLGQTLDTITADLAQATEKKHRTSVEDALCQKVDEQGSATHADLIAVEGHATKRKVDAIEHLVREGVFLCSGVKKSTTNPITYSLDHKAYELFKFSRKGGSNYANA
jgi:KaiC/GvpD/RAD55 family RecA-like ATPase